MTAPNPTIQLMKEHGVPLTRANFWRLIISGLRRYWMPKSKPSGKAPNFRYPGRDLNPFPALKTRKLLILHNARNAKTARDAHRGYAAVTRAMAAPPVRPGWVRLLAHPVDAWCIYREGMRSLAGGERMEEDKLSPARLIYDFYVDEGARLGQRTDWFLIFHAILLEAFFAAPHGAAQLIVGILGLLTSYLWFMTGYRQRWLSRHLGACMGNRNLLGPEVSGIFERIFEVRRKGLPRWVRWAMPVPTFAVVIPFAFTVAWLSLLSWAGRAGVIWVAAGLGVPTLATIWIMRLRNGPDISQELTDGLVETGAQHQS